jgi:branched-chain amino acid transport system permease protein
MQSDAPSSWLAWPISRSRDFINYLRDPIRLGGFIVLLLIIGIAVINLSRGGYSLEQFVQQFIFGLSQGSIYALIALGYTLVYGILFMINFAHGEVFMIGAYAGFFALSAMEYSGFLAENTFFAIALTMLAGAVASMLVAVILERVAYRPLRNAPRLVPLITAIGVSITLQELALRLFGADAKPYPEASLVVLQDPFPDATCTRTRGGETCIDGIDLINGIYEVDILGLGLRLRPMTFIIFFVSLIVMYALWAFIQRTKTGRAMRAVAEDKATSALMGINVDRVIVITFVLGGLLAGIGGVLASIAPGAAPAEPRMGFLLGIKAFTAAVVGGIGNVPGAMFGGLFLGVVESVGPSILGMDSQLRDVVAFGLLVFILIFRPTGIFGEVVADKKV